MRLGERSISQQADIAARPTPWPTPAMPLQNRVTPFGEIIVSPARGTLMGNRGQLHDDNQRLGKRRWATPSWVTCVLSFKNRPPRQLMQPNRYTELFFLDEATALAAGHRPCAECRHADYRRFVEAWRMSNRPDDAWQGASTMDRRLHAERVDRERRKVVFEATLAGLPSGVMVALGDRAFLKCGNDLLSWSPFGYGASNEPHPATLQVTVLTPRPIVEAIKAGYVPAVHATARDHAVHG